MKRKNRVPLVGAVAMSFEGALHRLEDALSPQDFQEASADRAWSEAAVFRNVDDEAMQKKLGEVYTTKIVSLRTNIINASDGDTITAVTTDLNQCKDWAVYCQKKGGRFTGDMHWDDLNNLLAVKQTITALNTAYLKKSWPSFDKKGFILDVMQAIVVETEGLSSEGYNLAFDYAVQQAHTNRRTFLGSCRGNTNTHQFFCSAKSGWKNAEYAGEKLTKEGNVLRWTLANK